jgi:hypothetical protein
MTARRLSPSSLSAILCSSVGLWVSCGALAVAAAEPGAPRIAVLPPFWWLGAMLLAGVAGAIVVRPSARQVAVLWLSALTILPFLPWLPPPLAAALLVFAGPLRTWVWCAVILGLAGPPLARATRPGGLNSFSDPRRAPWLAALVAAAVYLLAAWSISPQLPDGDEPHYLIIAQSLLRDRDIQIENNHTRGDYHDYFAPALKPDYLRRGANGQIYSIHAPGLPAVVAPALALFGYPGVVAFLALASAAATALAWIAVWRVTGDASASWFGWATVSLSAPFVFQAFTVYPDGLGAALVMAGVLAIVSSRDLPPRRLMAIGAALALLPWLHTRFSLTASALGVVILARLWTAPDRVRRMAAFAAIPAASAAAWFWFFYTIYGTPNPAAPYGGYTQSAAANVPRGLAGLLLDQQFGILPNAPVYLCAVLGFLALARTLPRLASELALIVVSYAVATAAYFMWWGGFSSPGRFLVSVLLPLAIPAGVWFAGRGLAARVFACGGLLLSVLITASLAGVARGALLYNERDGASKLLLWLAPLVNLTTALPSLFQTGPGGALLRACAWLLAIAVTAGVGVLLARRHAPTRVVALGLGVAAAVTGTTALATVWRRADPQPVTAARAGPAMLRALDPGAGQVSVRFQPLRRLHAQDVPPLLPIVTPGGGRPVDPLASVAHAAAATYRIDAVINSDAGSITAGIDRATPLWSWALPAGFRGPWRQSITLPVPAFALRIDGDAASRRAFQALDIRAERVPDSGARITSEEAGHAAHYGPAMVFLLSGSAFMERAGTWVAGRQSAEFAIVPESGATVHLFLRNFAVDNTVTVDAGGSRQQLSMKPREERTLDLPLDPGRAGTVVRIASAAGAKPSDLEPANLDQRMLGCWIEVR